MQTRFDWISTEVSQLPQKDHVSLPCSRIRKSYKQKITVSVYRDIAERLPKGLRADRVMIVNDGTSIILINPKLTDTLKDCT